MVPLPETAIDFSDLRSQSNRMNERVESVEFVIKLTIEIFDNMYIFFILLKEGAHACLYVVGL